MSIHYQRHNGNALGPFCVVSGCSSQPRLHALTFDSRRPKFYAAANEVPWVMCDDLKMGNDDLFLGDLDCADCGLYLRV